MIMHKKFIRFHIGLRTIKTTVAIIIAMVLVHFHGTTDSKYIFAMLGAMGAMEHTFRESVEACLTQVVGVLMGAVLSLLLLALPIHPMFQCAIGILLTITLYNRLGIRFSPSLPCMLIVIMCTSAGIRPIPYAMNRFWDTAIGLSVGMIINTLVFPYDNSRRIRAIVESLDKEVLAFFEEIFDGDSILPDDRALIRKIDELEAQLGIFSRQKFWIHPRRQGRRLAQFRQCGIYARQLVSHMGVLCHLQTVGILNDENRQQLLEEGANIRDKRKLELLQEADVVVNYHVAQVLRLRGELLEVLKKEK
jgi:uncharacterized membrane protein YgaE (UPF0421/DUF939 family)